MYDDGRGESDVRSHILPFLPPFVYLVVASDFKSYRTPCFACVGNGFVPFVLLVQTAAQRLSGIAVFNLHGGGNDS